MAAAGQQDMITILMVSKFKSNQPRAYWAQYLLLKNPEGLSGNYICTEHLCNYEQKKYNLNRFSVDF